MSFYTPHKRIAADLWANIRLRIILYLTMPRDSKILDLGCGPGYFGRYLEQLGNDVYYSDISKEELDSIVTSELRKLRCDATRELPYSDGFFDWVFCGDMLEHVEEDDAVLKNIKRILKPTGRAVVTVPAYSCLYGHHDRMIGHFRRYDRNDFSKQLKKLGFNIVKCRYLCSLLFFPFVVNQVFAKQDSAYRGTSSLENRILPILDVLSEIDSRIRLPFGIGLAFVLSK